MRKLCEVVAFFQSKELATLHHIKPFFDQLEEEKLFLSFFKKIKEAFTKLRLTQLPEGLSDSAFSDSEMVREII